MSPKQKSSTIDQLVQDYFKSYPLETYEGLVRVSEIVSTVRLVLSEVFKIPLTPFSLGQVYDAINLFGPAGEQDVVWLKTWGGDRIEWVDACEANGHHITAPKIDREHLDAWRGGVLA